MNGQRKRLVKGSLAQGSAMVEAALCLAILTPIVFTGVRLGYGVNQVHSVQAAASEAAKTGAACSGDDEIRQAAIAQAPELRAEDIRIERVMGTDGARPAIRVSIQNYQVERLSGREPLPFAPAAEFPYFCE